MMEENCHATRVPVSELCGRIDATFYSPECLTYDRQMKRLRLRPRRIVNFSELVTDGTHKTPYYVDHGVPFLSATNIHDGFVHHTDHKWIHESEFAQLEKWNCAPRPGDVLVAKSGSIGSAAVVANNSRQFAVFESVAIIRPIGIDPAYLSAFLNSRFGSLQIRRHTKGAVIRHLHLEDLREVEVPEPNPEVQHYIGDKVRQSQRLKARAEWFQDHIKSLVVSDEIANAMRTPDSMTSRPLAAEMSHRLDAKYYGLRALRVLSSCQSKRSMRIAELDPELSNGFESREFVENGIPYITVADVSSGRLNLLSSPRIPMSVSVPGKAKINTRCVLVARSGSIGYATKVHSEDTAACISSHLIRLQFPKEEVAAAVAVFLASAPGKVLQKRIVYGGVQPQISQEELLEIPIPRGVLDSGGEILRSLNEYEMSIRSAFRLASAAKLFVEALIEGRITEQDLSAAQQGLEGRDQSFDRAVLSRLTADGIDVADKPPLFPNLDALYATIEESQRNESCNRDSA